MNESKLGDKSISGIEKLGSLPLSVKYLGASALALGTAIVIKNNNEGPIFPLFCLAAAIVYAGRAVRNDEVNRDNSSNES